MTYYINPIWFYLVNVGDLLHALLVIFGLIVCLIASVFAIIYVINADAYDADEKASISNLLRKIIVISGIVVFIGVLIPSKETCIEMMITSQITQENITYTKKEIYELVDYITDKVNGDKESEE